MNGNRQLSMREVAAMGRVRKLFLKLGRRNDFVKGQGIYRNFVRKYPLSDEIHWEYADFSLKCRQWADAFRSLKALIALYGNGEERDRVVIKIAEIYRDLGQVGEAERRLVSGLRVRPKSIVLRRALLELSALLDHGVLGFELYLGQLGSDEFGAADEGDRFKMILSCVAMLRYRGRWEEADELLLNYGERGSPLWQESLIDGYHRIVVYCNGRTRMEYRTKILDIATGEFTRSRQMVVTFDTMLQNWDSLPYSYKPLAPRAVDFLSVRKASKTDFHQDFSREEFKSVAVPLVGNYDDVVAIGQSLGGYSSLYYAVSLPGCRVLASAPRNPQNPKHSGPQYSRYDLFRHEYDMMGHADATPTIVYDPKNSEDGPYVERLLRRSFPKARFVAYPYCGHSIPRFLLEVGLLKATTFAFCDGIPFPEFDRSLRGKSAEYLRNLARINYAAGRPKLAVALLERALELGTYPERTQVLLEKIQKQLTSDSSFKVASKVAKTRSFRSDAMRWLRMRLAGLMKGKRA